MADDFDHEHQGLQPPRHGPREVLEVLQRALLSNADPVVRDEHDQRAGRGRVQVARRAHQPRHEAHEVPGKDEQAQGRDEWEIPPAIVTDDIVDEPEDLLEHDFQEVLEPARDELNIARGGEGDAREDDHDEPRVGHVVGDARQMEDRRMLNGFHAQRPLRPMASPRAITSQGRTLNPAISAMGCTHPVERSNAQAAIQAVNRSPAPINHATDWVLRAAVAAEARAASHRKFTTASAPPASVPTATGAPPRKAPSAASAETAAEVSSVTRAVSSPGVIELPFRTLD